MNGCPSDEELGQFLAESLSAEAAGVLESHLEQCPSCQHRLQSCAGIATPEHWREQLHEKRSSTAAPELGFLERLANLSPQQILNESGEQRLLSGDLESPERRSSDSRVQGTFAAASNLTNPVWPAICGYEVLGELGRGGMGVVYKARQIDLKRLVALKMLRVGDRPGADALERFRREAETVARLQHPNLVQVHEIGWHDGLPYICQEYVSGGNLTERLAGRPQPLHESAQLVETLARAMHYAHARGIVHRDLKPANVLLQLEDRHDATGSLAKEFNLRSAIPKIADFGLAKPLDSDVQLTRSGLILGTPSYMAPEQVVADDMPVGPAADIYALGAILYEMITGRPPFLGRTPLAIAEQLVRDEPLSPVRQQPEVPRDLETICLKCLEKDASKRYATAEALAEDLRRFRAGETLIARPVGWLERGTKWARRRPEQAVLAAALVIVSCLGVAGMIWQLLRVELARASAVLEKEAAEWQSYRANIASANSALELQNTQLARQNLDAAPMRYRNWEWQHLTSQLDSSQFTFCGHSDPVTAVAFSPDGKRIASASLDKTVRLWDSSSGGEVAVWQHSDLVRRVMFSPDGERIASADYKTVRLWNARTAEAIHTLMTPDAFLASSPDGKFLIVRAMDWTLRVVDTQTGASIAGLREQPERIASVAFSQDGSRLVGGASDSKVYLWDMASGRLLHCLQGHASQIVHLAFSPDGTRIASSSYYPDTALRLWDAATGELIAVMAGHTNQCSDIAFSPDGSRLVSASWDQTARLWDATTGRLLATLSGHRGRVTKAAFQNHGTRLATASEDSTLRLWNATTGALEAVLCGHDDVVEDVAFSSDGTRIASASGDGTIRLWEVERAVRHGLRGHAGYVYEVAFSPDSTRVASAAWDGTVRLWNPATGQQTNLLQHEYEFVTSVAFSPDGKQLVSLARTSGVGNSRVYLWDLATRKPRYVWESPRTGVSDARVVFNRQGTVIAAASDVASAHLWDVSSGNLMAVLGAKTGNSCAVAFSPDGDQLASAERDATVRIWNVSTGEPIAQLHGHSNEATCICYSQDGGLIASGGLDKSVCLWDAKSNTQLAVLRHGGEVYGVAFSPDGTRLATACRDNTLRLWDVGTREEVVGLRGHEGYVHAVAFSANGTQLASCSGDFTVRIWDTFAPQEAQHERLPVR